MVRLKTGWLYTLLGESGFKGAEKENHVTNKLNALFDDALEGTQLLGSDEKLEKRTVPQS